MDIGIAMSVLRCIIAPIATAVRCPVCMDTMIAHERIHPTMLQRSFMNCSTCYKANHDVLSPDDTAGHVELV